MTKLLLLPFSRGVLSANLNLAKGKNIITVKANNEAGSDQSTLTVTYAPPLPKPTVTFTSPSRKGFTVKKDKTTIGAIVKNVSHKNDITIKVNGKPLRSFNFNPKTNKVSATINLKAGENKVTIEGRNKAGQANAVSSVRYERTLGQVSNPPRVNISSVSDPTTDPFNPHKAKSTIIAKMENVTAKEQITFMVNGKPSTSFNYNARTQTFQSTINVRKGKTKVNIKVNNGSGTKEASRTITF